MIGLTYDRRKFEQANVLIAELIYRPVHLRVSKLLRQHGDETIAICCLVLGEAVSVMASQPELVK